MAPISRILVGLGLNLVASATFASNLTCSWVHPTRPSLTAGITFSVDSGTSSITNFVRTQWSSSTISNVKFTPPTITWLAKDPRGFDYEYSLDRSTLKLTERSITTSGLPIAFSCQIVEPRV